MNAIVQQNPSELAHAVSTRLAMLIASMPGSSARGIAKMIGLTDDDWDVLRSTQWFKQMVLDALNACNKADASNKKAIETQAQFSLEHVGLPTLVELISSADVASGTRLAAIDTLKDIAAVGKKADDNANIVTTPFVTINLSGAPLLPVTPPTIVSEQ